MKICEENLNLVETAKKLSGTVHKYLSTFTVAGDNKLL
jgi:hypothetical protein